MANKRALTEEQEVILEQNLDKMPSDLARMPEFEGVSKSTLAYRRKIAKKADSQSDSKELAEYLQQYMDLHGFPAAYLQPVSRLIAYLKK